MKTILITMVTHHVLWLIHVNTKNYNSGDTVWYDHEIIHNNIKFKDPMQTDYFKT